MRQILVSDRRGREIEMRSIALTAREMGIAPSTVKKRLDDGNWIHRVGYVPVRVRYK